MFIYITAVIVFMYCSFFLNSVQSYNDKTEHRIQDVWEKKLIDLHPYQDNIIKTSEDESLINFQYKKTNFTGIWIELNLLKPYPVV